MKFSKQKEAKGLTSPGFPCNNSSDALDSISSMSILQANDSDFEAFSHVDLVPSTSLSAIASIPCNPHTCPELDDILVANSLFPSEKVDSVITDLLSASSLQSCCPEVPNVGTVPVATASN